MAVTPTAEDVLAGRARSVVIEGAAEDVLPRLPTDAFAALITDPPSGISFMEEEWDDDRGGRASWVAWLAGILAAARARVVRGGRSYVWSLPRTSHWTGCAIEDAGWSIETETCHLFAQGWPKGKTQLKPAHEGWKLARNGPSMPLNIDDCRVGVGQGGSCEGDATGRWPATVELSHTPWCVRVGTRRMAATRWGNGARRNEGIGYGSVAEGAVTASHENADGTETIAVWRCAEGCPVAELDAKAPATMHRSGNLGGTPRGSMGYAGGASGAVMPRGHEDATANISRFFAQHPAVDPDEPDPFVYATKVPAKERWCLARCGCGERVMHLDAARKTCIVVESEDGRPREHRCVTCNQVREHTLHPTQKSVALMRRFVRLVTKPGDVILDPFGGSMTTGVAALLEGRRVVLVEKDPRFVRIGRARIAAAEANLDLPLLRGIR